MLVLLLLLSDPKSAAFYADLCQKAELPGFAIAEIHDGSIQTAFYGEKEKGTGQLVNRASVFQAASLSKPVFAYLCLRLVDQGLLDLDQPLMDLLANPRLAGEPLASKMTARHVLAHRSGLPNWGGDHLSMRFEPGQKFGYSGEGFVYLGQVVEKVTGRSLDALFQKEVFGPLKMRRSSFIWRTALEKDLTTPHDSTGNPSPKQRFESINVAASLLTTPEDYAHFLIALCDGVGLSPESHKQMFSAQGSVVGPGDDGYGTVHLDWGLGIGLTLWQDRQIVWHWGDNGDAKALFLIDAEGKQGCVYFANSAEGLSIGRAVSERFFPGLKDPFDMAGYESFDAPGRKERRMAEAFFRQGQWSEAVAAYQKAAPLVANKGELETRALWIQQLIEAKKQLIVLDRAELDRIAGHYGPRTLEVKGNGLVYSREGQKPMTLIPVAPLRFGMDRFDFFQLEVLLDESGNPVALVGHYANGEQDRSDRTP
ncbi:MAG: beta-lactamase family protein [Acidobacteria bacterium]|nr:beta-lactamase family protein [Acidobacteriota bacterium]MCB9397244.1 beta-lactamase family protein [Acidobacteriota bacterium]